MGVVGPLLSVSVTVAVHVAGASMATGLGEQLTAVDVASGGGIMRVADSSSVPVNAGVTVMVCPTAGSDAFRSKRRDR
jgi:hypothetical protein